MKDHEDNSELINVSGQLGNFLEFQQLVYLFGFCINIIGACLAKSANLRCKSHILLQFIWAVPVLIIALLELQFLSSDNAKICQKGYRESWGTEDYTLYSWDEIFETKTIFYMQLSLFIVHFILPAWFSLFCASFHEEI